MQPLDPHTLFTIFEQGDEEIYKEHGIKDALQNPFVLMGMVLRGIENYQLMDIMYMRQFPEQYKEVRSITKYKYFNKLYGYLNRIDTTKFDSVHSIGESFDVKNIERSLNVLRLYYEDLEEYEKCATIKNYLDLIINVTVV